LNAEDTLNDYEYSDENEKNIFHYIPEDSRYRPMTDAEFIAWTAGNDSVGWLMKSKDDSRGIWYDPKLCDHRFHSSRYQRRRRRALVVNGEWFFLSLIMEFVVDKFD
jgi:hypothetical protein